MSNRTLASGNHALRVIALQANLLDLIRLDAAMISDLHDLVSLTFKKTGGTPNGSDGYFIDKATQLSMGVISFILGTATDGDRIPTLEYARDLISQPVDAFETVTKEMRERADVSYGMAANAAAMYLSAGDKERSAILATAARALASIEASDRFTLGPIN